MLIWIQQTVAQQRSFSWLRFGMKLLRRMEKGEREREKRCSLISLNSARWRPVVVLLCWTGVAAQHRLDTGIADPAVPVMYTITLISLFFHYYSASRAV